MADFCLKGARFAVSAAALFGVAKQPSSIVIKRPRRRGRAAHLVVLWAKYINNDRHAQVNLLSTLAKQKAV